MDEVDSRLGYELKRTQHALRLRMDETLRPLNLTTPQYATLSALEAEPHLSNADLARRGFVTPQTMNAIVANLEAAGWVTRSRHPTNGRMIQVDLTDEGRRLLATAHAVVSAVEARMVQHLDRDQQEALGHALQACTSALGG